MPAQLLTIEHLVHLGRLPRLQALYAAGFEDLIEEIPGMPAHSGSVLHTIKLTGPLSDRVKIRSAENVARFLLRLWPKLQPIKYEHKPGDMLQPDLELLNIHIRVVQGMAESRKRISARYGPDAVRLLLDERLSSF
ncbi:hypothetical protein FRC08_008201 [Ceratobasidium sp. 394]|nr:hypothetical protein FRC08_008201 [Ceratobasidium sp. 394]